MYSPNERIRLKRLIFGNAVEFDLQSCTESIALASELSLYPAVSEGANASLRVTNSIDRVVQPLATNPAIHLDLPDGFIAKFGKTSFQFSFSREHLTQVHYQSELQPGWIYPALQRLRSSQFTSYAETIGQRVSELLLVPSVFFDPDKAILHATALEGPDGGAILIGGTGGVGKTSSQLSCPFA